MIRSQLILGIGLMAALLWSGCRTDRDFASSNTAGRMFDYRQINSLQLGKTTPQDARARFGEPKAEKSVVNDFNEFTLLQYLFVKVDRYTGAEDFRVLTLEFVDDKLNGYIYGSSYPTDLGPRNMDGRKRINRQSSVAQDVTREIGHPDGKAYYTTTLDAFAEGSGDEIWLYDTSSVTENDSVIAEKTLVGFDRNGVVDTITTSKTKIN